MFENKSLAKEEILLWNERKCNLGGSSKAYKSLTSRREIQVQIPRKPAEKHHPEQESILSHLTMQWTAISAFNAMGVDVEEYTRKGSFTLEKSEHENWSSTPIHERFIALLFKLKKGIGLFGQKTNISFQILRVGIKGKANNFLSFYLLFTQCVWTLLFTGIIPNSWFSTSSEIYVTNISFNY